MPNLQDRTVLLTGAAGGIGRVLAKAFLESGAAVVAADVDAAGLERLGQAENLVIRVLDIADPAACESAVRETAARFGTLDILINNGALGMQVLRETCMTDLVRIDEIKPEFWSRMVAVNLSGAWYLTRAAVPGMRARGWGRIINVTTSFFTMLRGRFHPYGPAKAGLEAMSAGHAGEFAGTGITVNVVVPGGPADTPMVPAASGIRREDLIPPARMAPPMLWLCSSEADAVTGKRYIAAQWDDALSPEAARRASESSIGWPELAAAPVWPGGKPSK
jgi:NAD(P)-dependent dehydrogenase (short-subunit alcohol dehydrogenase family)